jgi:hypothetical protein
MNAVLAKEEYNTVWEEVKAFAVRMGRRPRILVAKMGQDGGYCIQCLRCVVVWCSVVWCGVVWWNGMGLGGVGWTGLGWDGMYCTVL